MVLIAESDKMSDDREIIYKNIFGNSIKFGFTKMIHLI